MDIHYATLVTCAQASGLVVVIDVIRAFTTACYAFEAGTEAIILVGEVEEALALRDRMPGSLLMGEVDALIVEGFDYGNSPAALLGQDLAGRRMIHRTSSGTQGVVRSTQAETILAASFVCAGATARYIRALNPTQVTLVISGDRPDGRGDEDAACADYLALLLQGQTPDPAPHLQRVKQSKNAGYFYDPAWPGLPAADIDHCARLDSVNYALRVERQDGLHIMKPVIT